MPGSRDPSYPDRQRIDSDVRAFLREPSTPWIVFDKDSRVDREELRNSYLSAGAFILQSGRKSVLSAEQFAKAPVAEPTTDTTKEPSGLAVASDIPEPSATVRPMSIDIEIDEPEEPAGPLPGVLPARNHTTWLAIASGATLLVVAGVLALGSHAPKAKAAAAQAPVTTIAAPRADEVPPPPEPTTESAPAQENKAAEPAKAEPKVRTKIEKPHSKFGRLAINGEARYKNVFFDGKRMLGKGVRSFAVLCGTHTIAVSDKSDAREVDIPCDGELVVTR